MNSKQLQMAMAYVSGAWLPVSPAILEQIQQNFVSGKYDSSPSLLFDDLKKDISLFMFCIRKVSEVVRARIDPLTEAVDPVALFQLVPLDEFKRILTCPVSFISRHKIDQSNQLQAERLASSVTSATVAEALSESAGIDSKLAYATALFRELGLTLIAWNYPHVYKRVASSLRPYENLDQTLSQMLGFSPSLLGVTIARSWAISPKIRAAMGDSEAVEDLDDSAKKVGETLARLCSVGEALARTANPERFPTATADWEKTSKELAQSIGKDQFAKLKETITQNLSYYLHAAPEVFKLPELDIPDTVETPEAESEPLNLGSRNKYIRSCPPALMPRFEKLYSMLKSDTIQKDAIDLLSKELIMPMGFSRGCIYLVEPDTLMLTPRLLIGDASPGTYKSLSYSSLTQQWNPVVAAFRSAIPIIEEHEPSSDPSPCFVAGCIGELRRAGVLYLEMSQKLTSDPLANPLVYFKALRQALNDCLSLS